MSFYIYVTGTREGVKRAIAEQVEQEKKHYGGAASISARASATAARRNG